MYGLVGYLHCIEVVTEDITLIIMYLLNKRLLWKLHFSLMLNNEYFRNFSVVSVLISKIAVLTESQNLSSVYLQWPSSSSTAPYYVTFRLFTFTITDFKTGHHVLTLLTLCNVVISWWSDNWCIPRTCNYFTNKLSARPATHYDTEA